MRISRLLLMFVFVCFAFGEDSKENTESKADSKEKSYRLNAITTTANDDKKEKSKYQSGEQISTQMIESNPSGNGDIGSLLRILPNVQFDNSQLRSTTPGEIDPAKISISGGLHYQNLFMIDGVSMNNDLDPSGTGVSGENSWMGSPGRSQGLALDTSLLESINILDSNISASYGGFNGGVIEANLRKPSKKFGAKLSYQITQGNATPGKISMTNYHLYDQNLESFLGSNSETNQPFFTKHFIRANIESKFNDNFGIISSFTTTQSFIPLFANASISSNAQTPIDPADITTRKQTQKRQIYNFLLKGYYDINENTSIELSYTYAPQYSYLFMVGTKDDFYSLDSGGHNVNAKTTWENALGVLTNTTSYQYLESSGRAIGYDSTRYWQVSTTKNWTNWNGWAREGGNIPYSQRQNTISNKIVQDFTPLQLWKSTHKIQIGGEIGFQKAEFIQLPFDFTRNNGSASAMTQAQAQLCRTTDMYWCDTGLAYLPRASQNTANGDSIIINPNGGVIWQYGQYFHKIIRYSAGNINVNNFLGALFLQDDVSFDFGRFGAFNVRLGGRLDYDSYMQKATFAHRFSLNYEISYKEFQTQFTLGINRYYGRNLYAYALRDGQNALLTTIYRDNPNVSFDDVMTESRICANANDRNCIEKSQNDTKFTRLKVPYVDEYMFGVAQRFYNFNLGAKYIHRASKDDIRYVRSDYANLPLDSNYTSIYYTYTNEGKSWSDVVTLSLENRTPLEFLGIQNFFLFAFDFTNVKRNFIDYASSGGLQDVLDNDILWEGQVIAYSQRPASNFVRPYTIRLSTTHSFNVWRAKILYNNFFRFRSSYDAIARVHIAGRNYNGCANNARLCPNASYNPAHNDKDQYVAQKIREAFTWDIRVGVEFNVYSKNVIFVNLDIFNILDSKNPTILETNYAGTSSTPTLAYEVGRQFYLELGYKW